jgi:hypothetical protein
MKVKTISSAAIAAIIISTLFVNIAEARPPIDCQSKTLVKDAFYGEEQEYDIKQGLVVEKRRSLLNRKKLIPQEGCFLGTFESGNRHCIVVHLDKGQIGDISSDHVWQCVDSDNPGNEFPRGRTNSGYDTQNLVGLAGNDFGSGSVASMDRGEAARKYFDDLKGKNAIHYGYCMHPPATEFDDFNGKTIFCQKFNKASGKPLFSFEYKYEYSKGGKGKKAKAEENKKKGGGFGTAFRKGMFGK